MVRWPQLRRPQPMVWIALASYQDPGSGGLGWLRRAGMAHLDHARRFLTLRSAAACETGLADPCYHAAYCASARCSGCTRRMRESWGGRGGQAGVGGAALETQLACPCGRCTMGLLLGQLPSPPQVFARPLQPTGQKREARAQAHSILAHRESPAPGRSQSYGFHGNPYTTDRGTPDLCH